MTDRVTSQEHVLTGRVVGLTVLTVPEFGTRACFRLDCAGQRSVICCVGDDVAREFIALYREGDMATVKGVYETRPSTASANTPWAGRFRIHALPSSACTPRRQKMRSSEGVFCLASEPAHS